MPKRFSTKNLEIAQEPTSQAPGVGIFEFTDDYSVFHYGKMPDRIPGKGEAICRMAVFNFQLFERHGVKTHFRRFLPPNKIEFDLLRILDDRGAPIAEGQSNYMIPLQVIFRNVLPPGASVFRRLAQGTASLQQFGWTTAPEPGQLLSPPVVEFTSKLEEIDRFVSEEEARSIGGLTSGEQHQIANLALDVDRILTDRAAELGLEHADGKIECGMRQPGEVILVDNAGTPDENRFMLDGLHVGKQVMRDFYLAQGLEEQVQELAGLGVPRRDWPRPEPLPPGFVVRMANMYKAFAEAWTGERVWGAPPLAEAVEEANLLNSAAIRW